MGEGLVKMFRNAFAAMATMAVALTLVFGSAEAQSRRIQLGTLTCSMSSSIGLSDYPVDDAGIDQRTGGVMDQDGARWGGGQGLQPTPDRFLAGRAADNV